MKERSTADRIHSATIGFLRAMRRFDDVAGLSAPRLSILSVLYFAGPMSPGALAAREQVTPATMTRHIQGLEGEGLVERSKTSKDNRVVTLALTRAGRARFEAARKARLEALEAAVGDLTVEERADLDRAADLLAALARRLTQAGPRGPSGS